MSVGMNTDLLAETLGVPVPVLPVRERVHTDISDMTICTRDSWQKGYL